MILLFVSGACEAGKKGTSIEGKVVDKNGKSLSGVKVVATQEEPLKGYEKFETKTKGDGSFVFKGLYPESAYSLTPIGEHCSWNKTKIITGPIGETKMVKEHIVARTNHFKVSNDNIITDSRTGLEWVPSPNKDMNWHQANQYVQSLSLAGGGWRLPTRVELRGLYESGEIGCGLGKELLNGGEYVSVWSSELDGSSDAWSVSFNSGQERRDTRDFSRYYSYSLRALAVRSRR
ncbi:MAG: DUF1566 domain-containing protein [Thermodesulfovibrionales bacterium]|nr:DUF1566 domain-containing protein [Thermodesulfovibrionales bacterium]MDP3113085.1 DUF1566 domain-containing protein [Thermodesulfovibrionales bacterium]